MAGINCPVPSSSPCAGYADGAFAVAVRKERGSRLVEQRDGIAVMMMMMMGRRRRRRMYDE